MIGVRVAWRILMVAAALTGIACLAITHKNPWVTFTVQSNTVLVAYYALAGLAFSAVFLLAGYTLIGLHRAVEAR